MVSWWAGEQLIGLDNEGMCCSKEMFPASELRENLLMFDIIRTKSKTQRVYTASAEVHGSDKNNVMSCPVPLSISILK